MSNFRLGLFTLVLSIACVTPAAALDGGRYAAEVYRSEDLLIRAGLSGGEGHVVNLGDVLSLVMIVSWDAASVSIDEPGERFFSDAWPGDSAPVLLEREVAEGDGSGSYTDERRFVFSFQIVGCPGEQLTCPGDRRYVLPEFTLYYRSNSEKEPSPVRFQPEPRSLIVTTTIARDAEGLLHPFLTYFPMGAYPEPLAVTDGTRASFAALGAGLLIITGGMLMWPFRSYKRSPFAPKETPRWQELLRQLQNEDDDNHVRVGDRLRRCLVWYCSDELKLDAFDWMNAEDEDANVERHAELRALFMDLLLEPGPRSAQLRARLVTLLPVSRDV